MDCSLPGSSVHGLFQARVLESVAISFSRGSSQPRDWTRVSHTVADALPTEPPGKSMRGHNSLKVKVLVAQWCLTFCDPMDCSPPGSSVHGSLQARILEWVAISFSRGSSQPRDQTEVSCIAGRFFTIWTTRQVPSSLRLFTFLFSAFLQAFCFLFSTW